MKLIDIFQQCDQREEEGTVCWPIEECIIVRGDDASRNDGSFQFMIYNKYMWDQ